MRLRAAAGALIVVVMGISGCTGGSDDDAGPELLAVGRGAIQGLLVDDRFRPLELTDAGAASGPQQREGFVLVQETGARVRSDADGVFRVADLSPGGYTLRPNVEGHEGTPQTVTVRAGQWAEANVVVRRVISPGDDFAFIYDTTILMTCVFQTATVYGTIGGNCYGDVSGDAVSAWIGYDLSAIDPIAVVVFEFAFQEVGDWSLSIHPAQGSVSAEKYAVWNVFDVDYSRHIMVPGETYEGAAILSPFDPYNLEVWIRPNHLLAQEAHALTGEAAGVGMTFQAKARSLMSVFPKMPPDLDSYGLLG